MERGTKLKILFFIVVAVVIVVGVAAGVFVTIIMRPEVTVVEEIDYFELSCGELKDMINE